MPSSSITDHSQLDKHPSSSGKSPYVDLDFPTKKLSVSDSAFLPDTLRLSQGSSLAIDASAASNATGTFLDLKVWLRSNSSKMLTVFQLILSNANSNRVETNTVT